MGWFVGHVEDSNARQGYHERGAHAWITAAPPMLFVSLDAVWVLADSNEARTYRRTRL